MDSAHPDEIEITAFSWGESIGSTVIPSRSGMGASLVSMRDFQFQARFSRASPRLFHACASGKYISHAVLSVQTSSPESPIDYITWRFEELIITSFDTTAAPFDSMPVDEFSISFGRIRVVYRRIGPDGNVVEAITVGWNLKTNSDWS